MAGKTLNKEYSPRDWQVNKEITSGVITNKRGIPI